MWLILKKKKRKSKRLAFSEQRLVNRKILTAKRTTHSANKSFTLIELMVATSIMGVIGLTILTTFASGFHVYERVQTFGGVQADVLLAFAEMEKDIKNTFPLLTIPFEGNTQRITFPAVIESSQYIDEEDAIGTSIGRISYYIDDALYVDNVKKGLIRVAQNYSQAIADVEAEVDQSNTLAFIEDLSFEYFYYVEDTEEYQWQDSWSEEDEDLLTGIKIVMTYKDGDRDVEIERTVLIPVYQKIMTIEEEEEEGGEEEEEEEGGEGEEEGEEN